MVPVVRCASIFLTSLLFLSLLWDVEKVAAEVPQGFLQEAKKLADLDKQYFNKRMAQEWEALYEFQHPEYRRNISFQEYLYKEGRADFIYRKKPLNHLSGGLTPSVKKIRKNPQQKDVLGFPRPHNYRWFTTPFVTVKSYHLEKVAISKDGNYAMVSFKLKGREQLNPALFRQRIEFDVEKPYTDYWEKVDGKWVITLLTHPAAVSGGRIWYYIPNNHEGWAKMNFETVEAKDISGK